MGQALGCGAGEDSEKDDTAANGSAGKSTGSGTAAANGKPRQPPTPPRNDQHRELFALSNTENNDSIQGLVRSGGCLWIGTFRLPPAQPGEDESEVSEVGRPV